MKLFITTSSCDIINCEVGQNDPIIQIKRQINRAHPEWPVPCMKLVRDDILFNDNAEINDYGIQDGDSSIRLVIKAIVPSQMVLDPDLERWYVNKK